MRLATSGSLTAAPGAGNGMVPHMSGTTLDAQYRYATGAQDILRRWFAGEKQESHNLIVENGEVGLRQG
jgi:formate dehydrogenase